jgi:hypothetical protein
VDRREGRGIWTVTMTDKTVGKTIFMRLESNRDQFRKTEADLEEAKKQYQGNLVYNETLRNRPIFSARRFQDAKESTLSMFNRIRRNLDVSTDFWRDAVLPPRSEWKL